MAAWHRALRAASRRRRSRRGDGGAQAPERDVARRGGGAAFAALVVALALPAGAGAHAGFLKSTPEPGTRLRASPPEVRLEFTEPLNRRLTNARIAAVVGGKRVPVAASVA